MGALLNLRRCRPDELPGILPAGGREHVYIETVGLADFRDQFSTIGDDFRGPLPSSGALMNEDSRVLIHSEDSDIDLRGVSYRGDILAWSSIIRDYCGRRGLLHASVSADGVRLSDGRFFGWLVCETFCTQA